MKNVFQKQKLLYLGISCTDGIPEQNKFYADPETKKDFFILVHRPNGISKVFYQNTLHWHDFFEMEFFYDGEGIQVLREESFDIGKQTLILRTPNDIHTTIQNPSAPFKSFNLKFTTNFIPPVLLDIVRNMEQPILAKLPDTEASVVHTEFRAMHRELINRPPYFENMVRNSLDRVCFILFRNLQISDTASNKQTAPIQKLISYLLYHFSEDVSLTEMAKYVQLSPNYLSEMFATKLGQKYTQYIRLLRLNYAKQILTTTDLPLGEIIEHCGFHSVSYFIRAFKSQYGISPAQYRYQHGNNMEEKNS